MKTEKRRTVFAYSDFRQYLRDHQSLCRRAIGIAKSHLSLILHGKRNLTPAKLEPIAVALKLRGSELDYFRELVGFNQARCASEKDRHLAAMLSVMPTGKRTDLRFDQYRILGSWHALVIRELARLPGFEPESGKISQRLKGRLTPGEAARALQTLLDTKLLIRNDDGEVSPSEETLYTTDDLASLAIRKYHLSCLDLGRRALDSDPIETREFASINIVATPEVRARVKRAIKRFREEIVELQTANPLTDAAVCQLNIQFMELT